MEMDPLAVVLPQYALEEALAESEARDEIASHAEAEDRATERAGTNEAPAKDDAPL